MLRPFFMMLDNTGALDAPKLWAGSAVTAAGLWTIDYSAAGFSAPPFVMAIPQLSAANVYDRVITSLSTAPTATGAAGYAITGANLLILGPTVRAAPNGTTIFVIAMGI